MRNRFIPRVGRVSKERMLSAIEAADEAFWLAMASQLPEVVAGDIDPGTWLLWEENRNKMAVYWVEGNHDPYLSPYELVALGLSEDAEVSQTDLESEQYRRLQAWREVNCV